MMRPFCSVILQLGKSIEKNSLTFLANILINHVLFSILWEEKQKLSDSKHGNNGLVHSFQHRGNEMEEPFLPVMKNKFTYTLVLDLDETLIHYFIVNNYL